MLFRQEMNQVEIAEKIFGVRRNDPVSRAMQDLRTVLARELLNKYPDKIVQNIGQKEDQDVHNSPSPDDIANVCEVLKEWLKYYYDWQYLNQTINTNS